MLDWIRPRIVIEGGNTQDGMRLTGAFGDQMGATVRTEVTQFAW